jgi:hypothetical protein
VSGTATADPFGAETSLSAEDAVDALVGPTLPTAGVEALRAGRKSSGSTYAWSFPAARIPRCTYGPSTSGSPLAPIVPTPSPSATVAPFVTAIEPRWTSVTDQPSAVSIDKVLPPSGTTPANVTIPAAGARTVSPAPPPTSMPRCWPPAYGWVESKENRCWTGPSAGQLQARAEGMTASAIVRTSRGLCMLAYQGLVWERLFVHGKAGGSCCQTWLQICHKDLR